MPNLPYISPELLGRYQKEVSSKSSPATAKRRMSALKRFFGWAEKEGHIPENPILQTSAPLIGPGAQIISTPKPSFKAVNILKLGIPVVLIVLLFLLARQVKLPIPFLPAPALEPDELTGVIPASPTPQPVAGPTPQATASGEIDPIFSKIYEDGVLTLEGLSPTLKAIGGLLIEGEKIIIKTTDTSDGDIEINPDGSGIAHFLFEGTGQNFLNAQAPNLTSGSLYYGIVANNAVGYDLLRLQSGSKPITRFSVDALGNTEVGGNLDLAGNLSTLNVIRLTSAGALTNITGYSQISGNFTISQAAGDTATITKKASALNDVLTLTLDERGAANSIYSTLTLKRYDGAAEAMALFVDEGNARFDGQLELGRFSSNPTSIGQGSLIFNTSDTSLYVWNGSSWVNLGGGSVSGFWQRNLGALSPTNITDDVLTGGTATASALVRLPGLNNQDAWFNLGTGNVGVGTTGPTYKLDVSSTASIARFGSTTTNAIELRSDDTATGFWIRNDASNVVLSTKVGDLFYGYQGRSGLTQNFYSGTTPSNTLILSGGNAQVTGNTLIGDASGNDYLEFNEEATNPTCAAGLYAVWANSTDLKLKKCQNGTITDLDTTGGSVAWNSITAPTGFFSLGHNGFTTSFDWDTGSDVDRDFFSMKILNDLVTDTTTQRLFVLSQLDDAISTGTTEALLALENNDANEAVTNGILFSTGGASTPDFVNGINFDAADFTTEIVLENGETIDNQTNNQINLGLGTAGTLLLTSATSATLQNSAGNLNVQVAGTGTTANLQVGAGGAGSSTPDLLVLDIKDLTGNPTGTNGAMYYNTGDGKFKCFEASLWTNCIGASGSSSWSSLTAPSTDLTLNMTTWITTFNWDTGTGTNDLFSLTTDASSNGTGSLLNIQTGASSTVLPLRVRVGTSEALMVDTSAFVGIGDTSPSVQLNVGTANTSHGLGASDVLISDALEIEGVLYLDGNNISNDNGTNAVVLCEADATCATASTWVNVLTAGSWRVENNSNLGQAALIVEQTKGTDGTTDIFAASASGTTRFRINRDGGTFITGTAGTLFTVGGGTGKIDVGTVDPVYNIDGVRYATYMAGMVGVKEETTGKVATREYIPGLGYKTTIDFKAEPEGSDLWLFSRAANLKSNIDKLVVLLSPSGNTRTWYNIDKNLYTLIIYSNLPTEISYRLTAPRFDYNLWTNYNDNPHATGFEVENEPLTVNGEGEIEEATVENLADLTLEEAPTSRSIFENINIPVYQLKDAAGNIIQEVAKVSEFVAANIKVGAIEAETIATKSLISFQATIDNLLVTNGLVSPVIETATISPLPDEPNLTVKIGQDNIDSGFGKLIVANTQGEEVASIDTQGNASFSGTLEASEVKTNEITAGKIYADEIIAGKGGGMTREEIEEMLREVEQDQSILTQASTWSIDTASGSANLEELVLGSLYVTETAALNTLSVTSSITLGSDLIIQSRQSESLTLNSIDTLSAPLSIQSLALAPVEIMAGKVRIETDGSVTISGNLLVAGQIESGALKTKELTTDKLIIAADKLVAESPQLTTGEITTNATAGTTTISAGITEITINNPNISDYTLVYVTPTSTTLNNVLYVKSKGASFFTVGFSDPLEIDVTFNWWVIDISP